MALQSFDTGRQVTLALVVNGAIVSTASATEFQSKQDVIDLKSRPINGRSIHQTIYDCWSGTFNLDRNGSAFDDFFANEETNYYAGLPNSVVQITQTIAEKNGAISQYRYSGVTLKLEDAGTYKQDSAVTLKVGFLATARDKVA